MTQTYEGSNQITIPIKEGKRLVVVMKEFSEADKEAVDKVKNGGELILINDGNIHAVYYADEIEFREKDAQIISKSIKEVDFE